MSRIIICEDCGEEKKHHGKGLCKKCYNRKWYSENREYYREYHHKWTAENREGVREYKRKWDLENPERLLEYKRKWRLENPEYNHNYHIENKAKRQEYSRKWKFENPEYRRKWYAKNLERARASGRQDRQRRIARMNNLPATLTEQDWQEILDVWDYRCAYCGEHNFNLAQEHVIPVCQGGGYTIENIVPACKGCNCKKGGRTPIEAGMSFYYQAIQNGEQV